MSKLVAAAIVLLCAAILAGHRASDLQTPDPITPNEHTSPAHKGGNIYGR